MARDIPDLFRKIMLGDRVALGMAMTLIESELPEDRADAIKLLDECEHQFSNIQSSLRLTISGSPGVGKSTLVESIGLNAIKEGHKVGVLTIDPTSNISKGSILGDKSRMPQLSLSSDAFVRSSPAGPVLGGIGRRSREMMTLLAAAGYNLIFVETVGVGQSEHIAWQLTDGFILVIQPGSGDELQGIKRGITELADMVVVNKDDGVLKSSAAISRSHYQNAIHYLAPLRSGWTPRVTTCSAIDGTGIDEFWEIIRLYWNSRLENNSLLADRKKQNEFWLSWSLGIAANQLLMNHPLVNQKLADGLFMIENGKSTIFSTEFEIEKTMKELITTSNAN